MPVADDKEVASMASTPKPGPKSTIQIDHRTNRSIPMFLLHHLLRPFATKLITANKEYPAGSSKLEPARTAKSRCDITERVVEDMYLYDLRPKHVSESTRGRNGKKQKRIYYFAGGGWQMPASSDHWVFCSAMANETDAIVTVVSYPLAPHSPAPKAFDPLMRLYRKLMRDATEAGDEVILAGDSAGGNIVLCLTLAALAEDASLPAPKALMVLSPSCDLSRKNPDIQAVAKHDPVLRLWFCVETANKWRGEWDAEDPRITPLNADVSLLALKGVQVHGVVGRYDILSPDVILFRDMCEQAGVRGEWLDWEKQMHVFPLAYPYLLPESVKAKQWIMDVLRRV